MSGELIKECPGLRQELLEVAGDVDEGDQDEHGPRHAPSQKYFWPAVACLLGHVTSAELGSGGVALLGM